MAPLNLTELPLNWRLAVARFERDTHDDLFPDPLLYRDVLNLARKGIENLFDPTAYEPEKAESWEVPKPNLTFRHIIHVSAIDRIVYQALVDHIANKTDPKLSARCRAFRLRGPSTSEMFQKRVLAHKEINAEARAALAADPAALLVTIDIAQYFENISIDRLEAQLADTLGSENDVATERVVSALVACLASWCPYRRRGIPQNMNPSSHLGNVFLNGLDHTMTGGGWNYWRYMDDLKIVVPDEARAREALRLVIEQLRGLELSVNSEKTRIIRPGTPQYREFVEAREDEIDEIERAIERGNPNELQTVGQRLYAIADRHLQANTAHERGFRFSLGRLTSLRRTASVALEEPPGFAVRLIALLKVQPADTPIIRDYFAARSGDEERARTLAMLLVNDPVFVYAWQNYHLWVQAALDGVDDPALVERARRALAAGISGPEMAGAAVYLGSVGEPFDADLVRRALLYGNHTLTVNRALCVALQRLEDTQRTHLFQELAMVAGTIGVLAKYLIRLPSARYASRPRRVTLRGLVDAMPDNFS